MKKVISLFAIFVMALFSFGQQSSDADNGGSSTRDFVDWVCMQDYVFSQIPDEYNTGVYCDQGWPYTKVADDYSASGSFSGMRFWGVYDVKSIENFLIEVYDGQPGQPATNVIHTFNVVTSPIATPYLRFGEVIHEFNASFGMEVTQLNGWISISRTTLPYSEAFAWMGKSVVGNSMSYLNDSGIWEQYDRDQFFCLGVPPPVPISNWALFIALGLIIAFTIIRYRRHT
jgi:hypothetical protein